MNRDSSASLGSAPDTSDAKWRRVVVSLLAACAAGAMALVTRGMSRLDRIFRMNILGVVGGGEDALHSARSLTWLASEMPIGQRMSCVFGRSVTRGLTRQRRRWIRQSAVLTRHGPHQRRLPAAGLGPVAHLHQPAWGPLRFGYGAPHESGFDTGAGRRGTAVGGGRAPRRQLEAVGALPGRAAVGHRARGLLRARGELDGLPPRPCPE